MKFSVIIQARTGSSRLPNKVMKNYKKFRMKFLHKFHIAKIKMGKIKISKF